MPMDLLAVLRDISNRVANPSLTDVARLAQDLMIKQVRQSFTQRQTPDEEPWQPLKRPSFGGVLKSTHRHLLDPLARGANPWKYYGRDTLRPSESFLSLAAYKDIGAAKVTDKGFETPGRLPGYWSYQDQGTSKTGWGPPIPERGFWAFGEDTLDLVAQLLADKAVQAVATVGG